MLSAARRVSLCVLASVATVSHCTLSAKRHLLWLAGSLKEGEFAISLHHFDAMFGCDESGFGLQTCIFVCGMWCIMMFFFVIVVKKDSCGHVEAMAVAYGCGAWRRVGPGS